MTVGTDGVIGFDGTTTTTTQILNRQLLEDGETKNGIAIGTKTEDTALTAPRAAGTVTITTAGTKQTTTATPGATANDDGRRNDREERIGTINTTDEIGTGATIGTAGDPTVTGIAVTNRRRRRIWAR